MLSLCEEVSIVLSYLSFTNPLSTTNLLIHLIPFPLVIHYIFKAISSIASVGRSVKKFDEQHKKKNVVLLKNPSTKDTWKVNIESIVFFIFQSSFICVRKYGPFVEVRKKSKVKYFEYFKALFVLSVTAVEPLSFSGNSFMILEIYRGCLISRSFMFTNYSSDAVINIQFSTLKIDIYDK